MNEGEGAVDDVLGALAHQCRRRVVLALATAEPESGVDQSGFDLDDDRFDDHRVALHHRHLPRLEEAGLVDWDRDAGRFSRGPRFEEVRELVPVLRGEGEERAIVES